MFFNRNRSQSNITSDLGFLSTSIFVCLFLWKVPYPSSHGSYPGTCLYLLLHCNFSGVGTYPTFHLITAALGTVALAHSKNTLNVEWIKLNQGKLSGSWKRTGASPAASVCLCRRVWEVVGVPHKAIVCDNVPVKEPCSSFLNLYEND